MIKICQECGLEFETKNGMQKYCRRQHFRKCVICGADYEVTLYHLSAKDAKTTCSRKCNAELRRRTNMIKYGGPAPISSKEIQEKVKATNLKRYGVEHAMQSKEVQAKMAATNLEKYGVEWYGQSDAFKEQAKEQWSDPEIREYRIARMKESTYEKYGVTCVFADPEIRKKCADTYEAKTGYRQPWSNPEVQQKSYQTNMERYGVEHPMQSPEIMKKFEQTNIKKYGFRNPMMSKEIQDRAAQTCLERYGNTCYLQSDLGRAITAKINKQRYGDVCYTKTAFWKQRRMLDPSKIDNLMNFRSDPNNYIDIMFKQPPTIRELAQSLGIHENTAGQLIIEFNLSDKIELVYSYMELEVYQALMNIDSNMIVERNTHKVITPLELDIFLPQYNIAIECNPTATHNSSINLFSDGPSDIPYNYHLNKTLKCEEKGIFLFHLFGSEWTYSQKIIESMLRNLLHKTENVIYARKCKFKEVSANDAKDFLNNNHRQGAATSKVRYGLYHDNELVSLMTIGKMRSTIGTGSEDLSDCWELVRFCSKLNTSVVGGASKLFKQFLKDHQPTRVRSFSDRAHTRGTLYETLGFNKVRESDPGYVWVDSRTDISYHRYNAQKQNLKNFLHDDDIDLSKSEREIMIEHGFLQVYDCGTVLWEYKNLNI